MSKINHLVKISGIALIIFTAFSAEPPKPTILFNGKDLKGWYGYTAKTGKVDDATKIFKVENGEIKLQGKEHGYIATVDTYKNYSLRLEFCWGADSAVTGKTKSRNSGVMYNVPADWKDALWPKGIQFQVKENHTGDFILMHNVTMKVKGTTYGPGKSVVIPKMAEAEKKAGEWNLLEIVTLNDKCTQYLNKKLVNQGENASDTSGRIVLMYEGYPIKFRNIELVPFR